MASTTIGEIVLLAKIDTKDYEKGANQIDSTNKKIEKSSDRAGSKASKLGASIKKSYQSAVGPSKVLLASIAAVGAGLVAFGVKSVSAFNTQARAEAELVQLHKENTGATKAQTQSLLDQASALQRVGVIGDEAIIKGQAQLSTFKLSTDAIKNLTPAMADMVAQQKGVNATGDDFVNIGNLIGKVMEGNIGALGRYGVSFDENSEKILKNGTEAEKSAELAKVLANNYGGVNEALRKTPEGKIQSLKNRFGDLQEQLGGFILKGIEPLLDGFDGFIKKIEDAGGFMEFLKKTFEENKTTIVLVAGAIAGALVPALISLAIGIKGVIVALGPWAVAGAVVAGIAFLIMDNWDTLKGFFSGLISGIRNTIVKGFNTAIKRAQKVIKSIKDTAQNVFDSIKGFIEDNKTALEILATVIGVIVAPAFVKMAGQAVASAATTAGAWISAAARTAFVWVTQTLPRMIAGFLNASRMAVINAAKTAGAWISAGLSTLKQWILTSAGVIKRMVLMGAQSLIQGARMAAGMALALGPLGLIGAAAAGAAFLIIRNWEKVKRFFDGIVTFLRGIAGKIVDGFKSVGKKIGEGISNGVKGALNGLIGGVEKTINGIISGINLLIRGLNKVPKVEIPELGKVSLPRFANGVRNFSGGTALVGERGPELVNLPRGSDVFSNEESRRMGGTTINQTNNITTEVDLDRVTRRLTWEMGRI